MSNDTEMAVMAITGLVVEVLGAYVMTDHVVSGAIVMALGWVLFCYGEYKLINGTFK